MLRMKRVNEMLAVHGYELVKSRDDCGCGCGGRVYFYFASLNNDVVQIAESSVYGIEEAGKDAKLNDLTLREWETQLVERIESTTGKTYRWC